MELRYPRLITITLEIINTTVDVLFQRVVQVISDQQSQSVFVSEHALAEDFILETLEFNQPDYSLGFSSANDTETEDEEISRRAQESNSRFMPSQTNQKITTTTTKKVPEVENNRSQLDVTEISKDGSKIRSKVSAVKSRKPIMVEHMVEMSDKDASTIRTTWENSEMEITLVDTRKLTVDSKGGMIESSQTGVSLFIPPGAVLQNEKPKDIYIKIYSPKDESKAKKNSQNNFLSPIVVCGPSGTTFHRPVELRLPFKPDVDGNLDLRVKTSYSIKDSYNEWRSLPLNFAGAAGSSFQLTDEIVAILVDHF